MSQMVSVRKPVLYGFTTVLTRFSVPFRCSPNPDFEGLDKFRRFGLTTPKCGGLSHRGGHKGSCRFTPTSATFFEFAIVTKQPPTIGPLAARLLRPGRRLRMSVVPPDPIISSL